jgi:hypothetical protein
MTQINDVNEARLKKQKATPVANDASAPTIPPGQVQVIQGNIPLLSIQLMDLILKELRSINEKLEKNV